MMGRPRKWTPATIVHAIQAFAERHQGLAPTPMDFAQCRDGLPHHKTVQEYYPSVHAAVAAAGLRRNWQGIQKRNQCLARIRRALFLR